MWVPSLDVSLGPWHPEPLHRGGGRKSYSRLAPKGGAMSEATKEVSQSSKRSRRELLAGAAGALGALAAESLGRIAAAQATQGQPVIAGKSNDATAPTGITNSSSGAAFYVFAATGTGLVGNGG